MMLLPGSRAAAQGAPSIPQSRNSNPGEEQQEEREPSRNQDRVRCALSGADKVDGSPVGERNNPARRGIRTHRPVTKQEDSVPEGDESY